MFKLLRVNYFGTKFFKDVKSKQFEDEKPNIHFDKLNGKGAGKKPPNKWEKGKINDDDSFHASRDRKRDSFKEKK